MTGVLQLSAGLSATALEAIADLERRVLEVDGGRLKLEWNQLRARPGAQVDDVLWWDGDRLLGFCGIYVHGGDPEITGMVDPGARRRGIGKALFDSVVTVCRERGIAKVLLIVPRPSVAGRELALTRGGTLDHSEHALVLEGEPTDGPSDPHILLRPATVDDAETVGAILGAAFDWTPDDLPEQLARSSRLSRTLVIEAEGRPAGTICISHNVTAGIDTGGIYGFAVTPSRQGRGIGRDVLRRCCRLLRDEGASRVGLEVAVENEHALGLYTDTGFTPVSTEDYYAVLGTGIGEEG
jgi:ribosomal protein S18 acetylase RimI-like enzyme